MASEKEGEKESNWNKGRGVIFSMCLGLKNSLKTSAGTCRTGVPHLQLTPKTQEHHLSDVLSFPSPLKNCSRHTHTDTHLLPRTAFCFQPTDSARLCYQTDSLCLNLSSSWPSFYFHPVLT